MVHTQIVTQKESLKQILLLIFFQVGTLSPLIFIIYHIVLPLGADHANSWLAAELLSRAAELSSFGQFSWLS